jgi:diguanylate cyclase (GGDEF)-like protein
LFNAALTINLRIIPVLARNPNQPFPSSQKELCMADVDDRRPVGHLLQFAALALLVFSFTLVATGRFISGIASLMLGVMAGAGWFATRSASSAWALPAGRAASLTVAVLGLCSLLGWLPELVFWNLLVPLLFFLLWPILWAAVLSLVFVVGVMALSGLEPETLGMLRHQLVPVLLLVTLLTGLFVYLREIRAQQLAPLRRTDTLTQASSQEHLQADLHTEIQRSEREGTALAVVQLALDPSADPLPRADRDALLRHLGRLLHEHLRIFDCYYHTGEAGFILILPCTETASAIRQVESIRIATTQSMKSMAIKLSLSAGVTGLNVGDDAESLIERAGEGLARAQARGGNRTQSWTDPAGSQAGDGGGES